MKFFVRIFFLSFSTIVGSDVYAQTLDDYRSVATGTWATIANWQRFDGTSWVAALAAPTSANGVITIQSPNSIQISANVTIDQVVINAGATLNWTGGTLTIANGAGVDLQVNGTMYDNRGAATPSVAFAAGATWQMGAAGTIIRSAGNSSNNWQAAYQGGISTIPSTAFWILRKTTAQNPTISTTAPATGSVYPNLIIENNTGATWTTTAGSTFTGTTTFPTVKGYLDIGGTGSNTVNFLNQHTNATPTVVNGNVTVRAGSTFSNNGTGIRIGGDITCAGTISYDANDGRLLEINGTANQFATITGAGVLGIYDLTINKPTGSFTLNSPITIDNILTLTSGIMYSTAVNRPTLNTNASVTGASNASFVSGPVRYVGYSALTFPVGKGIDYQPLGISASASGGGTFWTETFSNGCTTGCVLPYVGPNGSWTQIDNSPVNDGCGFPLMPNTWYVSGNECGNAVGVCGSVCGATDPSLHVGSTTAGDLGAAYDAGGWCDLGFGGLGSGTTTDKRAESPTINCTGYSNIILSFNYIENGATTLDNATLWYFNGTVWAQIADMTKTALACGGQGVWANFTMTLPASANGNPNVRIAFRWVNDDDGGGSDPSFAVDDITLSVAGPVSDFTCEYFYADPQVPYGNVLAPTLDHISNCEYWILSRNAGAENKFVTLNWDANSCGITPLISMRVARHDGVSTWQDEGNSATTGSVAAGSVTSNLITSFSPFTLGSTVAVVLPIELLEFDARVVDNSSVRLTWITASESNNDRFELERSQNGEHFEFFGSVKGAGNSVTQRSYAYTDLLPYSETSYYRLKQVDYDGKFTYTQLRPVTITNAQNIQIYPNPNNGNELFLNVENLLANELSVYVTDITGKIVASELNSVSVGSSNLKMVFPQKLASGTYIVSIKTAEKTFSCRLIVN